MNVDDITALGWVLMDHVRVSDGRHGLRLAIEERRAALWFTLTVLNSDTQKSVGYRELTLEIVKQEPNAWNLVMMNADGEVAKSHGRTFDASSITASINSVREAIRARPIPSPAGWRLRLVEESLKKAR